jgi:selenocysteine-specific translation elongation factor
MLLYLKYSKFKNLYSVVTGTVVEGSVKVGDEIEFPSINEKKIVKSIQMFKK